MSRFNRQTPITVEAEKLAMHLNARVSTHCVDFTTGAIVPSSGCPEAEVGEGRPALQRGARYVRIPSLDEVTKELCERFRREDAATLQREEDESRPYRAALLKQLGFHADIDPQELGLPERIIAALDQSDPAYRTMQLKLLEIQLRERGFLTSEQIDTLERDIEESNKKPEEDEQYREYLEMVYSENAEMLTGMRWLASLHPPCYIRWREEDWGVTHEYDPEQGDWSLVEGAYISEIPPPCWPPKESNEG